MAQDFGQPFTPLEEPKKDRPLWVIRVVILLVVLCCCLACAGLAWYLYTYGDAIFNLTSISAFWLA